MRVDVVLKGEVQYADSIRAVLRDASGNVVAEDVQKIADSKDAKGVVAWEFGTDKVALWWPVGYGAQTLYTLETTLLGKVVFHHGLQARVIKSIDRNKTPWISIPRELDSDACSSSRNRSKTLLGQRSCLRSTTRACSWEASLLVEPLSPP